jgi:hypothetical protein
MGFRGGTKTFHWVNESPRLLLLMLEVKREKMKRIPGHSTMVYLLREMIGKISRTIIGGPADDLPAIFFGVF